MTPFETIKTALFSLGANRLRAGLALLGIVIGVTAVISLMSIGRGAQSQITSRIESLGTNLLFIRPGAATSAGLSQAQGTARTLTLSDSNALVDPLFVPSVAAAAPEIQFNSQVVAGRNNTRTRVLGVTQDYLEVRNLSMASGMFISAPHVRDQAEVVVLGSDVRETLFGFRDPVGQSLKINSRKFTVIGVLENLGGGRLGSFDNQILVPITTAYYRLSRQRNNQGDVTVQNISVQAQNADVMDDALREINMVLRLRHRITDEDDFTVTSLQETIETLEETTNTFVLFLGAIAGISLLVGGIGIMNIMLVSVTERTREIGIRKAMGAKRRDIMFQFVTEATVLSLGGGGAGVVMGLTVSKLINGKSLGSQMFNTAFSGDIAILAMVVSAAIGLFFGIYPAIRASRMHPIEALRYE